MPSQPTQPSTINPTEDVQVEGDARRNRELAAQAALKWGKSPSSGPSSMRVPVHELPPDHPVHKIPLEKREKMIKKGINPVLRAEMDEMMNKGGTGSKFWKKYGTTSMGPWMV